MTAFTREGSRAGVRVTRLLSRAKATVPASCEPSRAGASLSRVEARLVRRDEGEFLRRRVRVVQRVLNDERRDEPVMQSQLALLLGV